MELIQLKEHRLSNGECKFDEILCFYKSLADKASEILNKDEAVENKKFLLNISDESVCVNERGNAEINITDCSNLDDNCNSADDISEKVAGLIVELMKNTIEKSRCVSLLKPKTREAVLEYFGINSSGNSSVGSINRLRDQIISFMVLNILDTEVVKNVDKARVYAYGFAADQTRFMHFCKALDGLVYVIEDENKECAVLFSDRRMDFVKLKSGMFQPHILEKIKIEYKDLLGTFYDEDENIFKVLSKKSSNDELVLDEPNLGGMDVSIIGDIVDKILKALNDIRTEDELYKYYSGMCHKLYDLPYGKDESMAERWSMLELLGERAYLDDDVLDEAILLETYTNIRLRAKIDGDSEKELRYKEKIIELHSTSGDRNRKMVKVDNDRQLIIPAKFYKALNIGGNVMCELTEDSIIIKPVSPAYNAQNADVVLEELIANGFKGEKLVEAFSKNLGIDISDEDDKKKSSAKNESGKKSDKKSDSKSVKSTKKKEKTGDSEEDNKKNKISILPKKLPKALYDESDYQG